MAADADKLAMLDQQLAAAIAEDGVAATITPAGGSPLTFEVSFADEMTTQSFAVTNALLDMKRLIQARIASFTGFTRLGLLGQHITVDGEVYRIVSVERGQDLVSWHIGLATPLK